MDISEIWPPFALHLQSDDMELSPVREADIPELAEIARGGVRRDGIEAFLVNWDSGTDEQVARSLAQYHWSTRANLTADEWTIEFTDRVNGRAIGIEGVNGHRFPLTRTVDGDRSVVGQNGTVLTEHHMALHTEDYVHTGRDLQVTGADAFRTFLTIAT